MIKEGIWHLVGYKNKFNLHPTGLGGVKNLGLKWHRYSLIRGPKWTKPGLIVTIYSINIHAQKKFGLLHHISKIWHFEILPLTPRSSWVQLPFIVEVKVKLSWQMGCQNFPLNELEQNPPKLNWSDQYFSSYGYINKFNLHPTGLGGAKNLSLKWHRCSLIRGPKWTKPGLIVTIYSVNTHAQKKLVSCITSLRYGT